eukprot:1151742-Pelagomonas_calceolata.AAC.2
MDGAAHAKGQERGRGRNCEWHAHCAHHVMSFVHRDTQHLTAACHPGKVYVPELVVRCLMQGEVTQKNDDGLITGDQSIAQPESCYES